MREGVEVEWTFNGKKGSRVYRGAIVRVVEARVPILPILRELALEHDTTFAKTRGTERLHESYIVLAQDGKLHWPTVGSLRRTAGPGMPDPL